MIKIRLPEQVFRVKGKAGKGSFESRWDFPLTDYTEPRRGDFGALKAFNDETLSPGAAWSLHPHRDAEIVTYCVEGEFRHFDDKGRFGVLKKGWVQHTSVGRGMWHSETNNRQDQPLRFIRMWFLPRRKGVKSHYEHKPVQKNQRFNRLLPLVSNEHLGALKINSEAEIFSSFLEKGKHLRLSVGKRRGLFVYVLEGGPAAVNGKSIPPLSSARVYNEPSADISAQKDSELILVNVRLN